MKIKNICGERVRMARLKTRMSQYDVAAALEVDLDLIIDGATIGKIERGERGVLDYELVALASVLEVTTDWLLEGDKSGFSLN